MRAQNKQMYADVGSQLGLSREDASKLIDLLTDQHVDGMAISREATDPTERMRLMNEARRENQAKIADLLGPEKLKLLEQYQQTIPVRQEVDMLARQLEGSDAAPLSDDQRKRLLAAIIEERKLVPPPDYRQRHARRGFPEDLHGLAGLTTTRASPRRLAAFWMPNSTLPTMSTRSGRRK